MPWLPGLGGGGRWQCWQGSHWGLLVLGVSQHPGCIHSNHAGKCKRSCLGHLGQMGSKGETPGNRPSAFLPQTESRQAPGVSKEWGVIRVSVSQWG